MASQLHGLTPAIGSRAQELALHRVDPREIGRNEVIAAALAGDHLKTTAYKAPAGPAPQRWMNAARSCFCCGFAVVSGAGERTAATLRSKYTAASSMAWLRIARIHKLG